MLRLCPTDGEGWGPLSPSRPVDLTCCFQYGVLSVGVSAIFIATAAVRLVRLCGAPRLPLDLVGGDVFRAKLVVATAALCVSAAGLGLAWSQHPSISAVTIAKGLQTAAAIAAALLHYREQLVSCVASTPLLLYWLASGVLALVHLRTAVGTGLAGIRPITVVTTAGYAFLAMLAIWLECQAKPEELFGFSKDVDELTESELAGCSLRAPEEQAHLFSRLTFAWIGPVLEAGRRKPLQMEDTCALSAAYYPKVATQKFRQAWSGSLKSSCPRLFWTTAATFRREWAVAAACQLTGDLVPFLLPILLSRLVGFVATYNTEMAQPIENGYFYAVAMFAVAVAATLAEQQRLAAGQHLEILLRTNLVTAIYRKALALSSDAYKAHSVGAIVTHMSTDVERAAGFVCEWSLHMVVAPIRLALALYMLYCTLGWSILIGVLVMVASTPLVATIVRMRSAISKRLMECSDRRMMIMNEVLSGIRIIKLYAWEQHFMQRINAIRIGEEMAAIRRFGAFHALLTFTAALVPFLVTLSTYAMYSAAGRGSHGPLNAQLVFVSLALFNMLKMPLSLCTSIIPKAVDARESFRRLHEFLAADEIDFTAIGRAPYDRDSPAASTSDVLVSVDGGTFKWHSGGESVLKYIDLKCRRDELVAVIGLVGSGKSSLVSAILGDMIKCAGTLDVCGSIAHVPQQPWLMNATLRDNIMFGTGYDQAYYDRVIDACALRPDLDMLPAGDMTEIGEKGINLSGGQAARVSLARAVYARADVYLLDNPLAAVDAHVAKHIFSHVLGPHGLLNTRARILVTTAVQYLSSTDHIVMLADGQVVEEGPFADCMARRSSVYDFVHCVFTDDESQPPYTSSSSSNSSSNSSSDSSFSTETSQSAVPQHRRLVSGAAAAANVAASGRTMSHEMSQQGRVQWGVYRKLIQACGTGNAGLFLAALVVAASAGVSANLWLKHWATSNGETDGAGLSFQRARHSVYYYLLIYGAFGLLSAVVRSLQALLLWTRCLVSASTETHQNMLVGVLRAPLAFFDTTPVGRILNRFSSDISGCDTALPEIVAELFGTISAVSIAVAIIGYSTPMIFVVCLPLAAVYRRYQTRYMACSRELKRLLSTTRSPIIAHLQESIGGVATIRAYGRQSCFVRENEHRITQNSRVYRTYMALERWLTLRLETLGNLVMLGTTLLAVASLHYRGRGDAGLVGLAVTYAMSLTSYMSWTIKDCTILENAMTHMERCIEYSSLPQEAPAVIADHRPDSQWPAQGALEFKDYSVRYREGLDPVLKGLSFSVLPGQKVGIVGRTGAGKSSLALALFRIIESAGGQILLDGQDIAKYGLADVRSQLSIIPQNPTLFAGTVRQNLDPFGQHSDHDIWRALEHAHLASTIRDKDNRLECEVAQGGENFSAGQRQLVCLARALLKRAKVLVLDEATAAIDNTTDAIIQQTIRNEFKHCTVLTIAHRLNTIIDSDMVLVVDGGRVAEYDLPQNLLQNKDSLFAKLVEEARTSDA
ncbi:hypothetical protein H4R19_000885 [Coemansia spiralis]|nr:hypothetical protein H4R19_000885 [Coemansia spiralis]